MVENAGFMPKDASVAKRVWYGVGKAVESQSPKAWEQRILRVIDKQIIPKLSPENQKWAAEVRPKVEKFAKVAGVAIPVVEVVAVVGSTVVVGKKIKEGIRIHKNKVFEKRFKKRYGFAIGDEMVKPIDISKDPRFIKAWSKIQPQKQEAVTPFTQWLGDVTKEFSQKYGPVSTHQMEQTIRHMSVAIGKNERGIVPQWRSIVETAQKGSPAAVDRAKRTLRKVFTDAYIHARGGVDRRTNPQRALIMDMMARDAFAKWENVQFPGLPELLNEGARYAEPRVGVIHEIVPKFWQDATDFEVIDRSPPPFEQVLAAYKGADKNMLLEMAEDPKWTRAVELLPNSPWGDIMDPNKRFYDENPPKASQLIKSPILQVTADATPAAESVEKPKRELSWWEKREVDKLQREELKLRKEKYGKLNLERKYKKETARLRAKQTDQSGIITYRDRLDQLANPPAPVEVLPVELPVVEVPAAPSQTPEQLLAQENATWLRRIREIARRRGQSPYGERFNNTLKTMGIEPMNFPDRPENPPFIEASQKRREAAILSEDFAMPGRDEDLTQWWKDREELGMSTSTLQEQARKEYEGVVEMRAREEAQRQAHRVAERLRVETRRANRDPLVTTLNYVFRDEHTPERRQWLEQRLQRARDIAERDVDMRGLLRTLEAVHGGTTLERVEETRLLAQVLERVQGTLPKSEQRTPDNTPMYSLASNVLAQFYKRDVPVSLIEGANHQIAGDAFIDRLLETNDAQSRALVRRVARAGTHRSENVPANEPTSELVDLFAHAYRLVTRAPQGNQLNKVEEGIIRKIANEFVRKDVGAIVKLYKMYPAK